MFPYRRSGKRRGKGGPGGRPGGGGTGNGRIDPRRLPGGIREVMTALQPATKALAQMLAGNTRSSGQLAHARNLLAQAQRLVDERQLDRVPPLEREEFLELLARLKLTITDAEMALEEAEETAQAPRKATPTIAPERLREMALALATKPAAAAPAAPEPQPEPAPAAPEPVAAQPEPEPEPTRTGVRGQRLRLKRVTDPASAPTTGERRVEAG
jgi:hypothetical protein